MYYKYDYYSREQLLANEKKCDSAQPVDDCMRSVTDCNNVCLMQIHILAYIWGFIWNETENIPTTNLDVCWEKHHPLDV